MPLAVTVHISSELIEAMLAHAASLPDEEVCGVLLGSDRHVCAIQSAENVAQDKARRFEIDPSVLISVHRAAREGGSAMIGCYHSHPAGLPEPSRYDAADAAPGSIWIIIASGRMAAWQAGEEGFVRLRIIPRS